jgi:hypothetical protein
MSPRVNIGTPDGHVSTCRHGISANRFARHMDLTIKTQSKLDILLASHSMASQRASPGRLPVGTAYDVLPRFAVWGALRFLVGLLGLLVGALGRRVGGKWRGVCLEPPD